MPIFVKASSRAKAYVRGSRTMRGFVITSKNKALGKVYRAGSSPEYGVCTDTKRPT